MSAPVASENPQPVEGQQGNECMLGRWPKTRGGQAHERALAGPRWQDTGLVFTTHHGAALDAGNVRKMFKRVCTAVAERLLSVKRLPF
jgi:hypothetical protein